MYDCDYVHASLYKGDFEPYFHPIIDTFTGKCIGAEVLARMVVSGKIVSSDNAYLSFLTSDRDQSMLTRLMLKKITSIITEISLPKGFILAFNLPVNILGEDWLLSACQDLMDTCERNLMIVLELTEHNRLMIQDDQLLNAIYHLQGEKIKLALDDYGTGYSNMALMQKMQFDYIKIPKEFINPLPFKKLEGKLIDNISHLARGLNINIIAEGVENINQSIYLTSRGITLQQGFYFSKPISSAELNDYLKTIIVHEAQLKKRYFTSTVFQSSLLTQHIRQYELSKCEREVLTMISEGLSVYAISERKHRSYKTIWAHKYKAYKKLGVKNDVDFINLLHELER
ncbi:EAL domain-containing protein [Citrobacter braakii]